MKDVTTIILSEEHRKKIEELMWETRAVSMSELIRNLIDNEYVRIKGDNNNDIN